MTDPLTPDTLSASDRRYDALLERIVGQLRSAAVDNLKRSHSLGRLVSEFITGCEKKRYGEATMEALGRDLITRGVFEAGQDVCQALYRARALFDAYPEFSRLQALAAIGFTATHARLLLAASAEVRQRVEIDMVQGGRVIPTRVLEQLLRQTMLELNGERSNAALEQYEAESAEEAPVTVVPDLPLALPDDPEAPSAPAEETSSTPDCGPSTEPIPPTVPRTGAPVRENTLVSPSKVISTLEKAFSRIIATVPDAFIVVRERAQTGFDSDSAYKRYIESLRALRAQALTALKPTEGLMKAIDEELAASDVPPLE